MKKIVIILILLLFFSIGKMSAKSVSYSEITLRQFIKHSNILEKNTYDFMRSDASQEEKDNTFKYFFNEIEHSVELLFNQIDFDSLVYKYSLKEPKKFYYKKVKFKLTKEGYKVYSINNPKTKLYYIQFTDEFSCVKLNRKYIYDKFARYLSEPWREFLYLSYKNDKIEEIDSDNNANYNELCDWIISWREFQDKYPDFIKHDFIENAIAYYTSDFIFDFYNFDFDNKTITPESKAAYEKFLKEGKPDTKEYRIIKDCYNELKNNNYKETIKYHKILYKYIKKYNWHNEKKELYKIISKTGRIY